MTYLQTAIVLQTCSHDPKHPQIMQRHEIASIARATRRNYLNAKLHYLVCTGGTDDVRKAIEEGADIDFGASEVATGDRPLHLAVRRDSPELVRCLLDKGADSSLTNSAGVTPLKLARDLKLARVIDAFESHRQRPGPRLRPLRNTTAAQPHFATGKDGQTTRADDITDPIADVCTAYYVQRTLACTTALKPDAFSTFDPIDDPDPHHKSRDGNDFLVVSNKELYDRLSREHPNKNVHWLLQHKTGTVVWHRSHGSMRALLPHLDETKPKLYTPTKIDAVLKMAQWRRIVLIIDNPGTGKSIFLTYISQVIKLRRPHVWVSRVDLYDCCQYLEDYTKRRLSIVQLCEKLFTVDTPLDRHVFWRSVKSARAVLMLDAVDEVSPRFKSAVDDLLQYLKDQPLEQLWVTARPFLKHELIDLLGQMPYYLMPFSDENQDWFFTNFYLTKTLREWETVDETRLKIFVDCLIALLLKSVGLSTRELVGTPLHARMMAETFEDELEEFLCSPQIEINLPNVINLIDLYQALLGRKFGIFLKKSGYIEYRHQYFLHKVNIVKNHQFLALEDLYPRVLFKIFDKKYILFLDHEYLEKYGVVSFHNDAAFFFHKSFVDFLVADFIGDQLRKAKDHTRIKDLFVRTILAESKHRLLRSFLNDVLPKTMVPACVLEQIGKWTDEVWSDDGILRIAVLYSQVNEGHSSILELLFDSLKRIGRMNTIGEMLASKVSVNKGTTLWHLACHRGHKLVLLSLWKWATVAGLNIGTVVCGTNAQKMNMLHVASENGHNDVLKLVLTWVRSEGCEVVLINAKNVYEETVWHAAVRSGKVSTLCILWDLAVEMQLNIIEMIVKKNKLGLNMFHLAIRLGNCDILKSVWSSLQNDESRRTLLNEKNGEGDTVLAVATQRNDAECLFFIMKCADELGFDIYRGLTMKNTKGYTIWHMGPYAAIGTDVIMTLKQWADETKVDMKRLFEDRDGDGNTLLHVATGRRKHLKVYWSWAAASGVDMTTLLTAENRDGKTVLLSACEHANEDALSLINKWSLRGRVNLVALLAHRDCRGNGPWHLAAQHSVGRVIEMLRQWTKRHRLDIVRALSEQNHSKESPWHCAAFASLRNMKKFRAWTESVLDASLGGQLMDPKLWLAAVVSDRPAMLDLLRDWCNRADYDALELIARQHERGYSVWLYACDAGGSRCVETLWNWAKKSGDVNLMRRMLLQVTDDGCNVWHLQMRINHWRNLDVVWSCTHDVGIDSTEMLNAKNNNGETAWDLAAKRSPTGLQILNKLTSQKGVSLPLDSLELTIEKYM